MRIRLLILTFILTLVVFPRRSAAQDDFRFQAPPPPPLDVDFGDDDDDELGDFSRPPGAPPATVGIPGSPDPRANPVPPGGFGEFAPNNGGGGGGGFGTPGGNFGGTTTTAGKFRFQVIPGEYWAKGKKRQRGNETHVTDAEGSRADGAPRR